MTPMDVFAGCCVACVAWTAFVLGRGRRADSFDQHVDAALEVTSTRDELSARRAAKQAAS